MKRSLLTYAALPLVKKLKQKWDRMPQSEKKRYLDKAKNTARKASGKNSKRKKK